MKRLQAVLPGLGIFFLAVLVRIIYNLTTAKGYVPTYDAWDYQRMGMNLLTEHCFCMAPNIPTTRHAPLWPLIIAAFYALLGPQNLNVRLFLCFVGAGTAVFVYLFVRNIFGKGIAIVAGIMAAVYPGLFIYDGWLYTESLYTFLLMAVCYTLYLVQRTKKLRWMFISGALLGLLCLTRPNGPGILALVVMWALIIAWARVIPWKVALQAAVIIAVVSLTILAPWTIRNYIVSNHQIIPVATSDGIVLLGAYNNTILVNTTYRGMWMGPSATAPDMERQFADCNAPCEPLRDAAFKKATWQWVQAHTSVMPYLLSLHFINLWAPTTPDGDLPMYQFPLRISSRLILGTIDVVSIPLFLLAALGVLLTYRWWRELLFFYFLVLFTIGESIYFYGSSRFRAPIEPILLIFVVGVVWWIVQQGRQQTKQASAELV